MAAVAYYNGREQATCSDVGAPGRESKGQSSSKPYIRIRSAYIVVASGMESRLMAKRALIAEDKRARRGAILDTALALFNSGDGGLPTASQIASASGLAKGTVYIYFQTKEEIFATLLLEGWIPVLNAVSSIFDSQKGKRSEKVNMMIAVLVEHLQRHPELLRLDALVSGVLEKSMPLEVLERYQREFRALVIKSGTSIDRSLRLASGRGVQLLVRTHALVRGLWQSAQHKDSESDASVPHQLALTPSLYAQELAAALREYWRGALA